ncbi:MAG: protein kinase domain-containing protein, partial [Verrucomicrobiales bacterium]
LKVIKIGMDTREFIARFEAERQALAMMNDPNIATVLDGGATESGRPYFVMEMVKGIPITQFCNEQKLNTRQRLDIFLDVCSAVQHAHQKGIIHRDLKPSNILVTLQGDTPVPKVIDFGIAKAIHQPLTDKTLFTRSDHILGTPTYMSPEQAAQSGLDIDTRADIYSLGVLLYELLAGKPPFDSKSLMSAGYDEMRRIIREEDPPKPSLRLGTITGDERSKLAEQHHTEPYNLGKQVRGDLDWIVMKAMEKERTRRYATANAVAQDIRRHLRNEPVVAAAPSVIYKLNKFVRRNRSSVAVIAAISVLLVAGIATSSWLAVVADRAKGEAVDALAVVESQKLQVESSLAKAEATEEAGRKLLYATDMQLAPFVWDNQSATGTQLRQLLDAHDPEKNEALMGKEDLRGFEWRYYKHLVDNSALVFSGHSAPLIESAFTSEGGLVSLDESGQVRHWDLESQVEKDALRRNLPGGQDARHRVLSSDGGLVALAVGNRIQVLDTSSAREICHLESADARNRRLIFTPAGDRLVVVDDMIRWCDTKDGRIIGSLDLRRTTQYQESITLFADGLTLAVVGHNNSANENGIGECLSVFRLDPAAGKVVPLLEDVSFEATLSACAGSPDGQLIAVGAKLSGVLAIFDLSSGEEIANHGSAHPSPISAIAFSGNGAELATADSEGTIKIWQDARTLSGDSNAETTLKGHEAGITKIAFSPDGRKLVSSSADHTARVWNVENPHAGISGVEGQRDRNFMARSSPDGRLFALADGGDSVRLLQATTGEVVRELRADHQHRIFSVAFSPEDRNLLAVGHGGSAEASFVSLWDIGAGTELARLPGGIGLAGFRLDAPTGVVGAMAFSPDGRYLAAGFGHPYYYNPKPEPNPILIWEVETRRVVQRLDGHLNYCRSLEFSRDGALLASGSRDGTARIWSTKTWEMAMPALQNPDRGTRFTQGSDRVEDLAISPDGRILAMASGGGAVLLWNFKTGELLEMLAGHSAAVNSVEFSPDGHTIVSGSSDQTVRLWNLDTRRELMQLNSNNFQLGEIWTLAFSPDGGQLLGGGSSTAIWSTRPTVGK